MFNLLGNEKSLPEKALTLGAIGMGVGFGTCGLGLMVGDDRMTPYIIGAGAVLFYASLATCIITGLIMLGRAILERFKH